MIIKHKRKNKDEELSLTTEVAGYTKIQLRDINSDIYPVSILYEDTTAFLRISGKEREFSLQKITEYISIIETGVHSTLSLVSEGVLYVITISYLNNEYYLEVMPYKIEGEE